MSEQENVKTRRVTLPTLKEIEADLADLKAERARLMAMRRLLVKLDGQGILPGIEPDEAE